MKEYFLYNNYTYFKLTKTVRNTKDIAYKRRDQIRNVAYKERTKNKEHINQSVNAKAMVH